MPMSSKSSITRSAVGIALLSVALLSCVTVRWYEGPSLATNDTLAMQKAAAARFAGAVAYGVIVDCGSSGSRVYVYNWPATYVSGRLLQVREVNSSVTRPGLSEFGGQSREQIDTYMRTLLDFAAAVVPRPLHRDTPLFVLCTAGMRKLSAVEQQRILDAVRLLVQTAYEFEFEPYYAEVISGKQEATYAWITANYLLDRFQPASCNDSEAVCIDDDGRMPPGVACQSTSRCRLRSVGMVEMGGASMQVAFELSPPAVRTFRDAGAIPADDQENNYIVELNLGCSNQSAMQYSLYAATYLNFGANSARDRYHLAYFKNERRGSPQSVNSYDPCLPKGANTSRFFLTSDLVPYSAPAYALSLDVRSNKSIKLKGAGNFYDCLRRINDTILRISCSQCSAAPKRRTTSTSTSTSSSHCAITDNCTIMASWQPIIEFQRQPFYGFSDFFYRYTDLYGNSGNYNESIFRRQNEEFCSKSYAELLSDYNETLSSWLSNPRKGQRFVDAQLQSQCFQAAYDYAILHYAFKFPRTYNKLALAGKVGGSQLQWTVGAIIYKTRAFPLRYKQNSQCSNENGADCSQQSSTSPVQTDQSWLLQNNVDLAILAVFTLCCFVVGLVTYVLVGRAKRRVRLRTSATDTDCRQGFDQQQPLTSV